MSDPARYDSPPQTPVARCRECNDRGYRGGNATFACARLAGRYAELLARVEALEKKS